MGLRTGGAARFGRLVAGLRALGSCAALAGAGGGALSAQLELSGYALGMASVSGRSAFVPDGTSQLARARIMVATPARPVVLDVAYEHVATRSSSGRTLGLTTPGASGALDWLGADWRIARGDETEWRHRLDRLSLRLSGERVELTVGRQAISWATTLFLTPADPFVPFDPSDPFRVYRAGVDAARLRYFLGPFTELEVVARGTETSFGTTATALARAQTSIGGWAVGAWAGALHDEPAGALFATGALGATAIRSELALREHPDGGATVRGALGVDRYFTPGGRDLLVLGEVQYDGFGASRPSNLLEVAVSRPFARGDMQAIGRWTAVGQLAYQLHPLVGLDALALANLGDGSALLAPGASWSATGSASVRAGAFFGAGPEGTAPLALGSEYGAVPAIGYLSLTWFF